MKFVSKQLICASWKDQHPWGQILLSIIPANVLLTIENTQNPNFIANTKFGISCLDRCNCLDQKARAHLLQGETMFLLSPKCLRKSTALAKQCFPHFKKNYHNLCLLSLKSPCFWIMACPSTPVQRTLGMSLRNVSSSYGSLFSFPAHQFTFHFSCNMSQWSDNVGNYCRTKPQKTGLLEM